MVARLPWWKRELARREGVASCPAPAADVAEPARFIPVRASSAVAPVPAAQTRTEIVNSTTVGRAVIEIVLSNGRIVRVGAEFDSAALGRVLSAADQPC